MASRRVLWLEAEGKIQPYASDLNFELIKKLVNDWRVTDIYAQVYRGGRSWFPSTAADQTPFLLAKSAGLDPLRQLLDFAHLRGIRVHAWLNVFSLARNQQAPVLQVIGNDGILRDEFGVSVLSYDSEGRSPRQPGDQLDTPAIWIDPASTRYREYFTELVRELSFHYPDLDGVHLDMVRYPYLMFRPELNPNHRRAQLGFSDESLRRYFGTQSTSPLVNQLDCPASIRPSESALSWMVLERGLPRGGAWDKWRREQVTDLLRHVRVELANRPMELSVAVLAPYERAFVYAHQPWKDWLAEGLIDFAVPMAYQRGVSSYRSVATDVLKDTDAKRVILGVGTWLSLNDPSTLSQQLGIACSGESGGVSLFSYSHLASPQGQRVLAQLH